MNFALDASAATVTEDGTVTALLLLVSVTTSPPVPAAAVSVAVHVSVPAPVIDPLVHVRELSAAAAVVAAATPVEVPLPLASTGFATPHPASIAPSTKAVTADTGAEASAAWRRRAFTLTSLPG